jgi:hypothetical protein
MIARIAEPLPECQLCERPTKRSVHDKNKGLCNACATGIEDTVRMLIPPGVVDLADERERRRRLVASRLTLTDETVYVETYRPPVPGQLELPEGEQ